VPEDANFQRIGSISNAHVGRDFEHLAAIVFGEQGITLELNHAVNVGVGSFKKPRKFDLGSADPKVIVECKSHKWTKGNNVPSAKITVWNEAMYYFSCAPSDYRQILFVLRDVRASTGESLAEYYVRLYQHMIPRTVELWEFDELARSVRVLRAKE
jgi:hypothetical protein